MGRGTKLNPEMSAKICGLVGAGNYLDTAAYCSGVDPVTVRRWMKRGEDEQVSREGGGTLDEAESIYVEFITELGKAMHNAEAAAVLCLAKAGREDYRAALAYLERRYPKKWGTRINVTVQQEIETFLNRVEERLPPEIYAQVLRAAYEPDPGAETGED